VRRRLTLQPLLALLCLSPLVLLTSCGGPPVPASYVRVLIESSPTNLDPRVGTDAQSERIDSLIFDPLVRRDAKFGIGPALATSWETPNPLTYIFHLRPGVRFSNGQLLTSRDVKWSLDTILDGTVPTVKTAAFKSWKKVDAPDPLTVVVHLKIPDTNLLWNICDGAFGVMPYGSGRGFWRHPIGSGPFLFVSAQQDKDAIVRRNPLYWGTPANIDGVRFMVVPDAITRALELQKGTADIESNALPIDLLPALAKVPFLRVQDAPGTELFYIIFNLRDRYLKDLRVREAIAGAIDRGLIIRTLYGGRSRIADSVLPPEHWAWTGNVELHPYDIARANAMLDAAGYRRGAGDIRFHITLKSTTDQNFRMLAAVFQEQLAAIGIALDIRSFEFATFYAEITKGAFQMAPSDWIGGNEAPEIFYYAYDSASFPPHGANRGFYYSPRVDALLQDAFTNQSRSTQIHDYQQVQQQVAHDLPVFYLWYADTVAVVNKRLSPLDQMPSGNFDFLRTVRIVTPQQQFH
jgi:peptide/nickel transport system substrate-binding protein